MIPIFFQLGPQDTERQVPLLKPLLSGKASVSLSNVQPIAVMETVMKAKAKGSKHICCTSPKLLQLLLGKIGEKLPSLDDYAGSIISRNGCEFLILNPLEHLFTVNYGKFLYARYLSKFLQPEGWLQLPVFNWELYNPSRSVEILSRFATADFISFDIETGGEHYRTITCIGFTAVWISSETKSFTCHTIVVPFTEMFNIIFARRVLDLQPPKVTQNGKYDNCNLLRYGCYARNWAFDTINLFHSWYAELPKRLDFITSFNLRNWQYWKDESDTNDLVQYYGYNAKDCFGTAMSWLSMLWEAPPYAWKNYLMEFPTVLAWVQPEMTGIKCDVDEMTRLRNQVEPAMSSELQKIQTMVGVKNFNPSSPKQMVQFFASVGSRDITNSTPPSMDKVMARHPINKRILTGVTSYRKDRKLFTSYLKEEKLWNGRIFYAGNPHGADTARNTSKESQFDCGLQIQNTPDRRQDIQLKDMYVADEGFLLCEADKEQAEARDTAYLSGDKNLIAALEDVTKDFHGRNASSFFGIPYEQLVDSHQEEDGSWSHKTLNKTVRDLSKRTNHGANYNMQAQMLADTMGIDNVLRAKAALKLPYSTPIKKVTQILLDAFEETYPAVRGDYQEKIKKDVEDTKMLVGPMGWTRYCFGHPRTNRQDLNSYAAHPSQSASAIRLNKAFVQVFLQVYLPNIGNFKLIAQIHDSIFFQYRIGYEHLAWQVKAIMESQRMTATDTYGITRNYTVPVALKGRHRQWSKLVKMKSPLADWDVGMKENSELLSNISRIL